MSISKNTVHLLLGYLEDCFLLRTVWIEADSERRRMVNPRKAYPVDPGLIPLFDRPWGTDDRDSCGIIPNTMPLGPRVVVDTNVVVAGLRSRRGTAFRLLSEIGGSRFEIALSVPLVLEYEDALLRCSTVTRLRRSDVDAVLDYLCSVGHLQQIFYLWRPFLADPKDDFVLELAVAARCRSIITYNVRDFVGAERFGVGILEPGPFLAGLGVLK